MGRNVSNPKGYSWFGNFYSRAPSGAQRGKFVIFVQQKQFLLTRPEWGATSIMGFSQKHYTFLLTRPEWGATSDIRFYFICCPISTHAPRVGRNVGGQRSPETYLYFYSRAPSGAQHMRLYISLNRLHFYSRAPSGAQRKTESS